MRSSRCRLITLFALSVLTFGPVRSAGATDFKVHGLLDLVAAERGVAYNYNILTRNDSPFDAYRLRVFADARVNDKLDVYTQVVLGDATNFYVDGAYIMYTPSADLDLHVLAGKVPWLVGTWAPRTYSSKNPLMTAPLMYQYHTTLLWYEIVPGPDQLIAIRGTGQLGVNYFGYDEGLGMPLVDDSYWDVGITVNGSARPFEYAVGVTSGTPGWGSTSQDENPGKSYLARVGVEPVPGMRVGVSGAYGPYLNSSLNPGLPPGKESTDYTQQLVMADAELLVGHLELRAEGARNVWKTPTTDDLETTSAYAELKYLFSFGGYIAGRWDAMRFGDIRDSGGALQTWDSDLTRYEAGIGYRFNRGTVAKVVYQRTDLDNVGGSPLELNIVAGTLSVSF